MKTRALNILVVDDDAATRLIVQTTAERLGHSVTTAIDGRAAIDLFAAAPGFFQVVITDHNMPLVNGLELVQHLRQRDFKGEIIVLSGFLTEALIAEYIEKQVTKILPKEFDVERLGSTLSDLLDHSDDKRSLG